MVFSSERWGRGWVLALVMCGVGGSVWAVGQERPQAGDQAGREGRAGDDEAVVKEARTALVVGEVSADGVRVQDGVRTRFVELKLATGEKLLVNLGPAVRVDELDLRSTTHVYVRGTVETRDGRPVLMADQVGVLRSLMEVNRKLDDGLAEATREGEAAAEQFWRRMNRQWGYGPTFGTVNPVDDPTSPAGGISTMVAAGAVAVTGGAAYWDTYSSVVGEDDALRRVRGRLVRPLNAARGGSVYEAETPNKSRVLVNLGGLERGTVQGAEEAERLDLYGYAGTWRGRPVLNVTRVEAKE